MTRTKRRLLIVTALVILVVVVLGAFFQVSTRRALERAEAFPFRRMLVTKQGEQGAYRFFYVSNRRTEQPDGTVDDRFANEREAGLKFGLFDSDIEPSLGVGMLVNPTDWFQNGQDIYWDCPSISFGRGIRRSNKLYLAGVASIHDIERSGRGFIEAVNNLVEKARPKSKKNIVRTAKLFDKDCQRLERQLKRVKICPRDRLEVLLCLRRKGLPNALGGTVLDFLV